MTEGTLLAAATRPFRALFQSDAKEGILLIAVAIAAMVVANSALGGAYHSLFDNRLAWSPIPKLDSLHMWINDAVMVVFFFVVGLEVKRELLIGDLSDGKTLRLPVMAAFAGMAVPAAMARGSGRSRYSSPRPRKSTPALAKPKIGTTR